MKRIARFQKVSKEQFLEGTEGILISRDAEKAYEELMLPKRATKGSAGYDFFHSISDHHRTRRDSEDPDRDPCLDGRGVGAQVLSEKWSWI